MEHTALERYTEAASSSARVVITQYSTSFSLACRMLDRDSRRHISNIYALVRLADEVVDGVAREAGLDPQAVAEALARLESETEAALLTGYSTNLIVHAFACTARSAGHRHRTDPAVLRLHARRPVHHHPRRRHAGPIHLRFGRGRGPHVPAGVPVDAAGPGRARRGTRNRRPPSGRRLPKGQLPARPRPRTPASWAAATSPAWTPPLFPTPTRMRWSPKSAPTLPPPRSASRTWHRARPRPCAWPTGFSVRWCGSWTAPARRS